MILYGLPMDYFDEYNERVAAVTLDVGGALPCDVVVNAAGNSGFSRANWDLSAVVTNVFDNHAAVFGTFNENRQTGALERFLTPMNARSFKLVLRRSFGE